jgi:diguanylate cyclase (GGDEF)-like protein
MREYNQLWAQGMNKEILKLYENKVLVLIAALVMVGMTGYLDYVTGYKISFSIFYLIPICLVTWAIGFDSGLIFSLLGVIIWLTIDYYSRPQPDALFIHIWNALVRMGFFSIITYILSKLQSSLTKESRLARVDFLTGMPNRHDFIDHLFLEMERSRRNKRALTLSYIDCDNFKRVNDEQGHEQGDLLLKEVANILMRNIRKSDQAARLGGDEFIVMLPETTEHQAREIFLRLHVKLLTIMELYQWPVTFSIGCVTFEDMPLSTKDAIREADKMMYQAKANGKNQLATKTVHSIIKSIRR